MPRRHFALGSVERLEGRALLSTMMVESEPNHTAANADVVTLDPADESVKVSGTIRANDRDFFIVPITKSGEMNLHFQERGKAQVALNVSDPMTGRSLFAFSGQGANQTGTFAVTAGETLRIRIASRGTRSGSYTFNIAESVPQSISTASTQTSTVDASAVILHSMGFDSSGQGVVTGRLANPNDVQSWSFKAPTNGRLTVDASKSTGAVIVQIVNSSGQVQLTVYSDRPNLTVATSVIAGASYQVRVRPQTMTSTPYSVSLSLA